MTTWKKPSLSLLGAVLLGALLAAPAASADKAVDAKQPAQKKDDSAQPASKQPANPLSDLVRGLFGGRKPGPTQPILPKRPGVPNPAQPDAPAGTEEPAVDKGDEVDRRAPHNPGQTKLLWRADALIRDLNWKDAMDVLQYLLDQPEDSLVRLPTGRWASVRAEANRRLDGFPPEELDRYEVRFGPVAEQILEQAHGQGEPRLFVEVASRFFHTESGQQAANHLGTLHFDRGEFGMAALWFRQLLKADSEITNDPKWRFKAACALRCAGSLAEAEELLADLSPEERELKRDLEAFGFDFDPHTSPASVSARAASREARLDDWLMFYGTPSRTGTAVGGEPLLLPRWSVPSTFSSRISETIDELTQDLTDTGRATIPAAFSLTVSGKVVFRTLRGVQVVETETGRLVWETREGISAERLLAGHPPPGLYGQSQPFPGAVPMWQMQRFPYSGSGAENHPLANLLFRNGTYGTLSSDGRRLFLVEDHAILSQRQPGYSWGFNANRNDPYRRDWSSNKLVAYNLSTGRIRWEVGGREMNEPFDLPLAGHYFFGAPVPDGDELFVVAEKDNEIRLVALAGETGEPQWSQMIASSDARIEEDFGRRWWTSQVAVADGVLVCPTTVGWLAAVDRMNRSVLWVHRYPELKSTSHSTRFRGRGRSMVQRKELNGYWCPSAPILVGNRVVYSPSEEPVLECLNLFDGKRIWQKPKERFLYLAGVFGDRVLLVGAESVAALSLETGQTLWTAPFAPTDGKPSGRGVAVGDSYYLPLQSGQLWTVNLKTGKVTAKSYLPDDSRPLGNLVMYRGTLLSLAASGLTCFEERDAIEEQIRRRKADNPHDPWALLREADTKLLNHDHAAALACLRQIDAKDIQNVAEDVRSRYRQAMIESLEAVVRSDFQTHDAEIEELGKFVQTEDERLTHRRLSAERLIARKDYRAAFDLYSELAETAGERMISRSDDSRVHIRMDCWLAGRLADLWAKMPQTVRAELEGRIAKAAEKAGGGDVAAQERFILLYGFHPSALTVRRKLAERYADAGDLLGAESLLVKLSRQPDKAVAAAALVRLGRLLRDADLPEDAERFYSRLEHEFGETKLAGGQTARELVSRIRQDGTIDSAGTKSRLSWGEFDLKLVRTGTSYRSSSEQTLDSGAFQLPFFHKFRFQVDHTRQRLGMVNVSDGSLHWSLPLSCKAGSAQGNRVAAKSTGHQLIVLHHDVVHCLSPVERKVRWARPLEVRGRPTGYYHSPNTARIQQMERGTGIVSRSSLAQQSLTGGMLAVANADYVCTYGRRRFTVLDALTGRPRFYRDGLPQNARIYGTDDMICVLPQDGSQPVALRALDGKHLDVPDYTRLVAAAIHTVGNGLVLVESKAVQTNLIASLFGQSSAKTIVRLYDPLTRREHWKHEFGGGTYLSLLPEGQLAALKPDGAFQLIDLQTGAVKSIGTVDSPDLKSKTELYTVADDRRVYLFINSRYSGGHFYSSGLPSVRVNGLALAFDRSTGKRLWRQKVSGQNLILEQLGNLPMLIFSARQYVRKGRIGYTLWSVLALDKRTGRTLIDFKTPTNSSFRWLDVNMVARYVDLRSYNERLRLTAVDRKSASAK